MLDTALLLLPDFLLIVAGWTICHRTSLNRLVWDSVERLVYWLLFPVLLFVSIVRSPLPIARVAPFGEATSPDQSTPGTVPTYSAIRSGRM